MSSEQEKVLLEQIGEQIRTARKAGDFEQAAHFAAQGHNIVHPEQPMELPVVKQRALWDHD